MTVQRKTGAPVRRHTRVGDYHLRSVYVSFYEAFPPISGAASVTWNCARRSSGEVTLIQLGATASEQLVDAVRVSTLVGSGRGVGKLLAIRRLVGRVVAHCQRIDPDLIVLEGASWAVYHWMLLHALRGAGLRAEIWYHSHNVEQRLRLERNGPLIATVTGLAERRLLRGVHRAFAVSAVDQANFRALYGVQTDLWPNGVDIERFDAVTAAQVAQAREAHGIGDQSVLFMGLYTYPPNKRAVDFLDQQVMPRVHERLPDAQLVVLGGRVPLERPWLINPGVVPFEQLPIMVKACAVGVAPVFEGSGTRLKILEYMAARLPVIATTKGAEGIDAVAGTDILLAEDAERFAAGILGALTDPALADRLGAAGHALVASRYGWDAIMSQVLESLEAAAMTLHS